MALADVYILPTPIKGPTQLAVHLAQLAKLKKNPVTEAVVLYTHSDNKPGIAWTELTNADLLQLHKFLGIALDDIYREEWREQLYEPENGEE